MATEFTLAFFTAVEITFSCSPLVNGGSNIQSKLTAAIPFCKTDGPVIHYFAAKLGATARHFHQQVVRVIPFPVMNQEFRNNIFHHLVNGKHSFCWSLFDNKVTDVLLLAFAESVLVFNRFLSCAELR
jgi:hypothetical protein